MIGNLIESVTQILDKFIPDADKKAELAHEIATLAERQAHEKALAQIEVNKAEAASASIFKGGWRPFVGWVCGAAFAYHYILQPFLVFVLSAFSIKLGQLPDLDMGDLLAVLGGLLGMGVLRTREKEKGIAAR